MDHDRYRTLKIGDRVLVHGPVDDLALYEGIVAKRDQLPGGAVVIGVLAPHGDAPSDQQVLFPGEGDLHAIPFDGTEHCFHCGWHKLNYLAGDRKHPFTGGHEPED